MNPKLKITLGILLILAGVVGVKLACQGLGELGKLGKMGEMKLGDRVESGR